MKILFLTNIPSPYMVDFCNELGKRCSLTVIFERESSGVRDNSWRNYHFHYFTGIILKGIAVKVEKDLDDQAVCPQIVKYISRKYDAIIVANPCTPTGIMAILWMKCCRIPYIIQSEGGFPKNGRGWKEKIKYMVMKNAALYLSTADMGDKYFMQYGAKRENIRRFPFSSLYSKDILQESVTEAEKNEQKKKLGIPYKKIVISVGRFIPVKGFPGIIKSFYGIGPDVGLYIIGGKPTKEYLSLCEKRKMKNVHFVDFVEKDTMAEYYKAADLFVLNSKGDTYGLVINEAMSYGLPIISTDMCYAAVALIESGKNGYICHVDDWRAFHTYIMQILSDDPLRDEMSRNNLLKARDYTLETMAESVYRHSLVLHPDRN